MSLRLSSPSSIPNLDTRAYPENVQPPTVTLRAPLYSCEERETTVDIGLRGRLYRRAHINISNYQLRAANAQFRRLAVATWARSPFRAYHSCGATRGAASILWLRLTPVAVARTDSSRTTAWRPPRACARRHCSQLGRFWPGLPRAAFLIISRCFPDLHPRRSLYFPWLPLPAFHPSRAVLHSSCGRVRGH